MNTEERLRMEVKSLLKPCLFCGGEVKTKLRFFQHESIRGTVLEAFAICPKCKVVQDEIIDLSGRSFKEISEFFEIVSKYKKQEG